MSRMLYPVTDSTLVQVPLYMLKIIKRYYDMYPKEFGELPTRVQMAIQDLTEYVPVKKGDV